MIRKNILLHTELLDLIKALNPNQVGTKHPGNYTREFRQVLTLGHVFQNASMDSFVDSMAKVYNSLLPWEQENFSLKLLAGANTSSDNTQTNAVVYKVEANRIIRTVAVERGELIFLGENGKCNLSVSLSAYN
jgi:hypothetical protein